MRTRRRLAIIAAGAMLFVAAALDSPASATTGQGGVLVVGDSLEVLTSPYLERHLPGVPLTVNAEGGYNSFQIVDLFRESFEPWHSVVVFDAGTNDNPAHPEILAANLSAVAAEIGGRCMVVPTIHGFTVDGVDNEGKNRVVAEFAASRPGTQVPDWQRVVATRPDLMQADNLHPTPEGADYRARLIAQGVKGCLAFMSRATPSSEPRLESAPRMRPVGSLASRQTALTRSVVAALGRALVVRIAGRTPAAAALGLFAALGGADA